MLLDYSWSEDELAQVEAHSYVPSEAPPWQLNPPDRNDKVLRRNFFVAEIRGWLAARRARPDAYMSSQEVGAAKDRTYLLLRSLLDGVAYCYRENVGAGEPGAKVLLGVLVTDTIFSDNEHGCSIVSAARMAKLLGCSTKSVLRARELLVENCLMCQTKHPGLDDQRWPVVNRAIAGQGTSTIWWLDATSDPPAPRGRPEKPQTVVVSPLSEKPRTPTVQSFRKTPDSKQENPGHLVSDEFSIEITEERKTPPPSKVTNPTQDQVDAGFTEWWAHYPRKEDRLDAKKAYVAIVTGRHNNVECRATIPQLLAALKAHRFPKDSKFTKLPATWLNKGSWATGAIDAPGADSLEMQVELVLKTPRGREIATREGGEAAARNYLRRTLSASASSTGGDNSRAT